MQQESCIVISCGPIDTGFAAYSQGQILLSTYRYICPADYPQISQRVKDYSTLLSTQILLLASLGHPKTAKCDRISTELVTTHLLSLHTQTDITKRFTIVDRLKKNSELYSALGILLNYLGKQGIQVTFQQIQWQYDTLFYRVSMDKEEFDYLEISREEVHPSLVKGKGRSKEGFTLLNAFDSEVKMSGAKRMLKSLFWNPTYSREVLMERYQTISWMQSHPMAGQIDKIFCQIGDLDRVCKSFPKHRVHESEWKSLIKGLQKILELKVLLSASQKWPVSIHRFLSNQNWQDISETAKMINRWVSCEPFGINGGLDSLLDSWTRRAQTFETDIAMAFQRDMAGYNFNYSMISYKLVAELGILIVCPPDFISPDPTWRLHYLNGKGRFYVSPKTQRLLKQLGDPYSQKQDREQLIFFQLQSEILIILDCITDIYWACCEIQCFWRASKIGQNMACPRLSSENLIIVNGWHFLLGCDNVDNHSFSFNHQQGPSNRDCL